MGAGLCGDWRGGEDLDKITVRRCVKFARVKLCFFFKKKYAGAGRGSNNFQGLPSHRIVRGAQMKACGPHHGCGFYALWAGLVLRGFAHS